MPEFVLLHAHTNIVRVIDNVMGEFGEDQHCTSQPYSLQYAVDIE
jgi:hypothetical protein